MLETIYWLILFIAFELGIIFAIDGAVFAGCCAGLVCSFIFLLRSIYRSEIV